MSGYSDAMARNYHDSVDRVVARLRDMADTIDRQGHDVADSPGPSGCPPFSNAAQRIMHEIAWGTANAGLDHVVSVAATADVARAADKA